MDFKERARELVSRMTLAEKLGQMRYDAPAIERLGIPAYNWWNECLHGVARSGVATVFPQAIGMAASFNPHLLHQVAQAISDEARAKYNAYREFGETQIFQGLTYWSPNINIFRDPRWGRGHETYGEDPYLTGEMGTQFVLGLQGDDPNYRKLDATLKHFAVHSGPEALRHSFDASVSRKDLYETYLYAFRYCIERAHPAAVMGAYNRLNGEPCCASRLLLEEILRGEWGFEGYVVSDCGAICDINQHHHVTQNEAESAALAVSRGCDLNCGKAYQFLKTSVALGLLDEATVTTAVERLFEARMRLGQFDSTPFDRIPYSVVSCPSHRVLSRKMAEESIVLLKNDGLLPLRGDETLAVIGPNADDVSVLLGNYNGTPDHCCTLLRGIQEGSQGRVIYARGCHICDPQIGEWAEHPLREAVIAARQSDVVILCMGLSPALEGEEGDAYNYDRQGDKPNIELPLPQKELFEAVLACKKPVIFVNVSGSALNLCRQQETCGALLQCFYPGAEGGRALADILFGRVNPSGRLPVTFYRSDSDLPPFEDYSMRGRTYRFFEGEPLYPFGYGLSYTHFAYEGATLLHDRIAPGEGLSFSVTLHNTGDYDGFEVIEAFLAPIDPWEDAPRRTLVFFDKVFLHQGASLALNYSIEPERLLFADDTGRFISRPGRYRLLLGSCEEKRCAASLDFTIG